MKLALTTAPRFTSAGAAPTEVSAHFRREVKKKRMTVKEENPAPIHETAPEEEALFERSSAPTIRDLRAAAKDMFTTTEEEEGPNSTPPNDKLPQ